MKEMWAEDLLSIKHWTSVSNDGVADSSGPEFCDDEDDDNEGWSSSESKEEMDRFSFGSGGDVDS